MDEVVDSVVDGNDTSGRELSKVIGKVVAILVIGSPISDTLTTVSEIGTSSETDLVVTISSGSMSGVVVDICKVGVMEMIGKETLTVDDTGGVSGTISSSDDSLRTTSFRLFIRVHCMFFATSSALCLLFPGETEAGILRMVTPLLLTLVLRIFFNTPDLEGIVSFFDLDEVYSI